MLEFLRDPAWQFLGAVFGFVALFISIVIYRLQRQCKALSYEIVSENRLLTIAEELAGRLQVLYEGQPTRDICLLVVKLINSGNVPIASTDYERPASIRTGASSKILSAVVTEVDPEGLSVEITSSNDFVRVQPVLLNPKDSITLKLLVRMVCQS